MSDYNKLRSHQTGYSPKYGDRMCMSGIGLGGHGCPFPAGDNGRYCPTCIHRAYKEYLRVITDRAPTYGFKKIVSWMETRS
jgi:hypothetical protein